MKLALSVFKDSIATVFDSSDQLLILETDRSSITKRETVRIDTTDPNRRAAKLREQGVAGLICGAISRPMQAAIASLGIAVYPFIRGTVEEVLAAYQSNRLGQDAFSLPGCRGRGDGRGKGRRFRCRWRQNGSGYR
ncbi:MAG: hypothetical protein GX874_04165 [Smithella sp.]|jgi:predicted Fe-Mo cluster-binding NifX family protein|nr:NifB/NifX family molybdenum-iron cluster-binding protein [Smithellaceae bacterium]NLA40595.1 hypothetical protein [Smithella sp.]